MQRKHKTPFSLVKTASLTGSAVAVEVKVDVSGSLIKVGVLVATKKCVINK
jgi:hypothetical protein